MSEREFEAWLALLGGLLKLNPKQRQDISEELRTHLEERLDDLIASGLSRDDAIAAALEEFGDAAGLAQHFTHIAHLRNRRRLMRWTYGTIAATTCAILTLAAFWPNNQANGPLTPQPVVAQDVGGDVSGDPGTGNFGGDEVVNPVPGAKPFAHSRERIEEKLSQPLSKIEFLDVPFSDFLQILSDDLGVEILANQPAIDHMASEPVTLILEPKAVSARTALQLAFEQLGIENEIGYTIRDEIIYITEKSATTEIQIYNVRDLVGQNARGFGGMALGAAVIDFDNDGLLDVSYLGGGNKAIAGGGTQLGIGGMSGMGEAGGAQAPMGQMMGGGIDPYSQYGAGYPLVLVVTQTIQPESWAIVGGSGSIQYFNGLLVIKHSQEVHREVKQLLELIRAALRESAEPVEVPGAATPTLGPPLGATPAKTDPSEFEITVRFERDARGAKTDPEPWVFIDSETKVRPEKLVAELEKVRRQYENQHKDLANVTLDIVFDPEIATSYAQKVIETAQNQKIGFGKVRIKQSARSTSNKSIAD